MHRSEKRRAFVLRSGKKKKGRGGSRPRGQLGIPCTTFVCNRRMGRSLPRSKNSCNDSWTGLICVQSGSKREKGEKGRRASMLTVQLEALPCLFREVLLCRSSGYAIPLLLFSRNLRVCRWLTDRSGMELVPRPIDSMSWFVLTIVLPGRTIT